MIVLGIETSCDDTSVAVYDGEKILSNVVSTQLVHKSFGGIVPELASRAHLTVINSVLKSALDQAGITLTDIEGIGVTYGPGLAGSLLVGLSFAKGLAMSLNVPIIGINHLEGHIWANKLASPELEPPFVILLVSGGHTQIVQVNEWGQYLTMGRTRDDAAGEAFDKVAKLLGLGYPGGPVIEKCAEKGDLSYIKFPRAYLKNGSLDFSFSGIKTAVLNHVKKIGEKETKEHLNDIAACFQEAVIEVLVNKTKEAALRTGAPSVCIGGGVAVNKTLKQKMSEVLNEQRIGIFVPPPSMCTDNGAMIAGAAHFYLTGGSSSSLSLSPEVSLNIPNLNQP
ncbi:tRNA (adenosine(37)-N6)-threonylcarbamoyltransferase complex transferase subunit TsaD [candidate division KSB1 bacterium]|nr:MAG: tRNA (adenosine(37)-N6)-threonylcarbamoyltransferase complex transferase subunit TsaD [candidate division KSB1 bacterium]